MFSPEFLREGRALHDNLHPSRIVVGDQGERGRRFADLLAEAALDDDVPVLLTDSTEAEAIKLFANTYLAMRVAYFNELDTYAATARPRHPPDHRGRGPRPADRAALQQPVVRLRRLLPAQGHQAAARELRRRPADADQRHRRRPTPPARTSSPPTSWRAGPKVVGIHRLIMKAGSDNFRVEQRAGGHEADQGQGHRGDRLRARGSTTTASSARRWCATSTSSRRAADVIVANRLVDELRDVEDKVYTRDLFGND